MGYLTLSLSYPKPQCSSMQNSLEVVIRWIVFKADWYSAGQRRAEGNQSLHFPPLPTGTTPSASETCWRQSLQEWAAESGRVSVSCCPCKVVTPVAPFLQNKVNVLDETGMDRACQVFCWQSAGFVAESAWEERSTRRGGSGSWPYPSLGTHSALDKPCCSPGTVSSSVK